MSKIIYLYGQPGVGKTTLGKILSEYLSFKLIDGDQVRKITMNNKFDKLSRQSNIRLIHHLALYEYITNGYGIVIACVSPFQKLRDEFTRQCITQLIPLTTIYLHSNTHLKQDRVVEYLENDKYDFVINTDLPKDLCVRLIKNVIS